MLAIVLLPLLLFASGLWPLRVRRHLVAMEAGAFSFGVLGHRFGEFFVRALPGMLT